MWILKSLYFSKSSKLYEIIIKIGTCLLIQTSSIAEVVTGTHIK